MFFSKYISSVFPAGVRKTLCTLPSEVLQPKNLHKEIARIAQQMVKSYDR